MALKGYGDRIAAREAQVVGSEPKIRPLDDSEMSAEVRAIVDGVRAGAGSGAAAEVPEYMRTLVKNPELFRINMDAGKVFFTGRISPREREVAILRIGWLAGAPYEWGEHVKIARRYGLTDEEIERSTVGSKAPGWSEHEAAIQAGVEELLEDFAISDATWDVLAKSWDEAQLLEFPAMVGQYVVTAYVQNSMRARLAEDNPGLTRR